MEFMTSVLVAASAVLIAWLLLRYQCRRLPPGPTRLPLLGSVSFFREFRTKRHLLLMEAEKRYGNIIGVWIGSQLIVFLQGYDVIHDAFVKQGGVFSGRPNWLRSLRQGTEKGRGVIWQTGEPWAAMRKFALQTLRGFGVGRSTLQEKIFRELDTVTQLLHERDGQPIVIKESLKKAITNIIHEIVFGSRFDYEDPDLLKLIGMVERFFQGGLFIPQNFMPPFLSSLMTKTQKLYEQKQSTIASIQSYISDQIEEHEISFNPENIRDFVDLYIQVCRTGTASEEDGFTNGNIFRVIMDLFLAGAETTAGSLDWCLAYMVRHPEVQKRCYAEIARVVDSLRPVEWSDRSRLPYTEAVLMETQRHAIIAPFGVPHATTEQCTLGQYTLPVDTIVVSNLYSASRDPRYWDSPECFRPERHLDSNGKIRKNPAWIPFSLGPRVCLGEGLAKMELFLFFTNLLKNFWFTSDLEGSDVTPDIGEGKVTSQPVSYRLRGIPRSESVFEG